MAVETLGQNKNDKYSSLNWKNLEYTSPGEVNSGSPNIV